MNIQQVPAAHGWLWISHGWRLIARNPLMALLLIFLAALGIVLSAMIPVVGMFIALLLMPVLLAGYMRACRALEYSETVEISHLFAGFEQQTKPLAALGGFLMLGGIAITVVIALVGGAAVVSVLEQSQNAATPDALISSMLAAGGGVAASLILGFGLCCALMLAFQYAPMLVFFDQMRPLDALKTSLQATLRNLVPFTIYSLIFQLIALLLSVVPYNLGIIVLLPLGFTSLYVSYRDIFQHPAEVVAEAVIE